MKKGQITNATHPKSGTKVQKKSDICKSISEKNAANFIGREAAAIIRTTCFDGNIKRIALIGTLSRIGTFDDGTWGIFDDCTFAERMHENVLYRHYGCRAQYTIRLQDIELITFTDDYHADQSNQS